MKNFNNENVETICETILFVVIIIAIVYMSTH